MIAPEAGTQNESIDFNSRRLWSLWEMLQLNASNFHEIISAIQHSVTFIQTQAQYHADLLRKPISKGEAKSVDDSISYMIERLSRLETLLPPMGAKITLARVERLKFDLTKMLNTITHEQMGRDWEEINSRFQDELAHIKLFFVEPDDARYYSPQINLFGNDVEKKLPQLTEDIGEAGICIAFGRSTAAVFHLMRVMEIGVQLFGSTLGVPLAHELNWQVILDRVNKAIKVMDHKEPKTKTFAEIAANLYSVKVAWRNEVMHPKQTYTPEQAKAIFEACRLFIRELAETL